MATGTMLKTKKAPTKLATPTQPAPAPATPGWAATWLPRLAAPLGSSLLLWMCFFPMAWGFLGWIALVPFLCLARHQGSGKRVFGLAYLCGLAFFIPALQWMRFADDRMVLAWIALAAYCALYFPVTMVLIRLMDRTKHVPLWLSVPIAWVSLEYVRSFMITGFAWYYLAHSQHQFLSIIQMADLGGAYLVSFLVAAVNALLVDALYRWPAFRRLFKQKEPEASPHWEHGNLKPLLLGIGLVAVGFGAGLLYGNQRLSETRHLPGPRVALLQSNIPQGVRLQMADGDLGAAKDTVGQFDTLINFSYKVLKRKDLRPDLVIWPETSFPVYWAEENHNLKLHEMPATYKAGIREVEWWLERTVVKNSPTNHLIGFNAFILGDDKVERPYNSAVLIDAKGKKQGRYDKIHRLPFGEYIPLVDTFAFLRYLSPYDGNVFIHAGERLNRLNLFASPPGGKDLVHFRFGVLICYEDTDPTLARCYGRDDDEGWAADFLVNISNDGWFKGSCEHEEHLAISRFRAVEARRSLVRSVNMGVSAVIDSNGRVLKPDELVYQPKSGEGRGATRPTFPTKPWYVRDEWHDGAPALDLPVSEWSSFKNLHGVIHATVPIDTRSSLYSRWGDWLPWLCILAVLGCILSAVVLRISKGAARPAQA